MYALLRSDESSNGDVVARCRQHITGIRPKGGRPPQTIEVDGEHWSYINPKFYLGDEYLKCEACETLESV
jgi:hypothetical protein